MVNLVNLVNFSAGGSLAVGDWTYSAYPLTAPSYLPLNNDAASYLTSSYPTLGAIYAPTTVVYSAAAGTIPPNNANLSNNVIYGNGVFMTYAPNGRILSSVDGVVWATSSAPIQTYNQIQNTNNNSFGNMAYGNGKFVILRQNTISYTTSLGLGCCLVTLDNGATWVIGGLPTNTANGTAYTQTITWTDIVFNGTVFVASGWNFDSSANNVLVSYSADGFTWSMPTTIVSLGSANAPQVTAIGAGSGTVVVSMSEPTSGFTRSSYSTDNGVTWSGNIATIANGTAPTSIAYGAGLFVLLLRDDGTGTNTPTNSYRTSPTGATWTTRTLPASLIWKSVTFANGYFVAIGYLISAATTSIYTSVDGINWVARTVPSTASGVPRNTVAGGRGKFIYTVGNNTANSSTVLINLDTASANFSLPYIRPIAGTQAFIKAT